MIADVVSQLISSRLFRRRRADERAGTLRAQGHGDIHLSLSRAFDEQTATRPGRWIRRTALSQSNSYRHAKHYQFQRFVIQIISASERGLAQRIAGCAIGATVILSSY